MRMLILHKVKYEQKHQVFACFYELFIAQSFHAL